MKTVLERNVNLFISLLLFLIFNTSVLATEVPKLVGRINDPSTLLKFNDKKVIEQKIKEIEKFYGVYVAILILNVKLDEPIEDFAVNTARAWGLGKKDVDNGLLFTIAVPDKKSDIELGYRLETILTDTDAKDMQKALNPLFAKGEYDKAVLAFLSDLDTRLKKEASLNPSENFTTKQLDDKSIQGVSGFLLIMFTLSGAICLFLVIAIIWTNSRNRKRALQKQAALNKILYKEDLTQDAISRRYRTTYNPQNSVYTPRAKEKSKSESSSLDDFVTGAVLGSLVGSSSKSSKKDDDSYDLGSALYPSDNNSKSDDSYKGDGGSFGGGGASNDWSSTPSDSSPSDSGGGSDGGGGGGSD